MAGHANATVPEDAFLEIMLQRPSTLLELALKLSPSQKKLLREQAIDENRPGTILADAQTVLKVVGPDGIATYSRYGVPPQTMLPVMNARMSRPLEVNLKRPKLKSYPSLHGIFLALRAAGLIQVRGSFPNVRLSTDIEILGAWHEHNAVEQYFALLEAWLLHARPEMGGEDSRGYRGRCLDDCLNIWQCIPDGGARRRQDDRYARYRFGHFHIFHASLMEMFGFVELDHGGQIAGKPWCPAGIKRLPIGDAVFKLVLGWRMHEPYRETYEFGCWHALFDEHCPRWRRTWKAGHSVAGKQHAASPAGLERPAAT